MSGVRVHASLRSPLLNARVRVLILGGHWPGPLDDLRSSVNEQDIDFLQPPLHMPPIGLRWCCTWQAILLVGCTCGLITALMSGVSSAWEACVKFVQVLGFAGTIPPLVVLLLRGSIRRSMSTALFCIERHRIDVVVGFSWGGGVACWLLAEVCRCPPAGSAACLQLTHARLGSRLQRGWRGPTLLLAPLHTAMARVSVLPPLSVPFFRAAAYYNEEHCGVQPALVHAVLARFDWLCPASQESDLARTGATVHACDDTHQLGCQASKEVVACAFASCVHAARHRKRTTDDADALGLVRDRSV